MGFYDLSKTERKKLVNEIEGNILKEVLDLGSITENNDIIIPETIWNYSLDNDTYIRKNTYLAIGRIYSAYNEFDRVILRLLDVMLEDKNEKVRQTSVYALGEIGKKDAEIVFKPFEKALLDKHHSVRNAMIGALKQMGLKNPVSTFVFVKKHLHDDDPKIRREITHGIELRGRTHPEEVLPFLKELQNEKVKTVRDMIIHVIGQISYKKGCLEIVVENLNSWTNRELVIEASEEIVKVHTGYKFATRTPEEANEYIKKHLTLFIDEK
jgi:3-methyladenine DNA glycosylase AlkD